MGKPSLAQSYRDAMRRHRFGYALYEPAPYTRLRPGMLGFLDDEYQRWHPILDLTDASAVKDAGFGPLGDLQASKPDKRQYGPLTAEKTTETRLELEGGVSAGLPVEVGGVVQYTTASGFGAVLLCGDQVVCEGFDFRDPFLAWLQRHAKLLFERYPGCKQYGLCAVTCTYSSEDVGITVWDSSEGSATVGFNVGVAEVAQAGPKTSWVRGSTSSGWSTWKDQKRVVFFAGVKIRIGWFGSVRQQPERKWRGAGNTSFADDGADDSYEVSIEKIGDEWHNICEAEEERCASTPEFYDDKHQAGASSVRTNS